MFLCYTQFEKDAFDYRNPYIVDWKFDVFQTEFNMGGIGYHSSDTSEFNGEITYGGERNTILIKYGTDAAMEIDINEDGDLLFKSKLDTITVLTKCPTRNLGWYHPYDLSSP